MKRKKRPFSFARPKENGQKEKDGEIESVFSRRNYHYGLDYNIV